MSFTAATTSGMSILSKAKDNVPSKWKTVFRYAKAQGRLPNLVRPKTYTEKLLWRRIYQFDERFIQCADKIEVKKYIEQRVGSDYLVPTLWTGKVLPDKDRVDWPAPFAIKANHGSTYNLFVRDLEASDWNTIQETTKRWMRSPYGRSSDEHWYTAIDRRILIEPDITPPDGVLPDFKVFVFNNKPAFTQVNVDRFTRHRQSYFDRDWNMLPFGIKHPRIDRPVERPIWHNEMLKVAEVLSEGFDFLRVDFYDLPEGLKIGELTFAPGAGLERVYPRRYDRVIGDMWKLDTSKKRPWPAFARR